jgi:hypothetical protein
VQFPAGVPWIIPLSASDPDLPPQSLNFQALGLPPGLVLDTNTVSVAGTGLIPGDYPVAVIVSDGQEPPLSATNRFLIRLTEKFELKVSVVPGEAELAFPAIVGQHYAIEYSDSAAPASWQLLEEILSASTNVLQVMDAQLGTTTRFYRVRWER